MQHGGKQDVHLFFNEKPGPVHRTAATDYKERFSFANYDLDGIDNAAIAVLVKRRKSGLGNIVNHFFMTSSNIRHAHFAFAYGQEATL